MAAHIITMAECSVMKAEVDYNVYERLNSLLSDFGANVIDTQFADNVTVVFSIKQDRQVAIEEKLTDVSNGRYSLIFMDSKFDKA